MSHRLMLICLGGLAGAGALVCCDLDEGLDELDAAPERETLEASGDEPVEAELSTAPAQTH